MAEIEAIFYIEGLGNDKKALEMTMEQTANRLKSDVSLQVIDLKVENIIENPENEALKYSALIEAHIKGTFESIVLGTIKYAPAVVDILSPGKLEVTSEELMKVLGKVSYAMGELMEKYGPLAAYPRFEELPEPKIGYTREELEEFIFDERMILYRFAVEAYGDDENEIKNVLAKAFEYEGCKINKLVTKVQDEKNGRKYVLVAAELVSSLEDLFQLTAKYAPVAISIIEPEIIDIAAYELQGALVDLAGFVYELVTRPLKEKIVEKETFKFRL